MSGLVPTTCLQKFLLGTGSALGALINPERGDLVATLGEVALPSYALTRMKNQMKRDVVGNQILLSQRTITDDQLLQWTQHPSGANPETLIGAYVQYMQKNSFLPSGRSRVRFITDPELAYVMQRYREVHDVMHALLGLGRTEEEEMLLKAIEWYQTGLPMTAMAACGAALRGNGNVHSFPWALGVARQMNQFYLNVDWERHMEDGITVQDMRVALGS
eukprot:PhF_6_TR35143/c0_g1_i1/m.51217/K18586/COQ4; ubiquinone biosynthesis protein COQ4